MPNDELYYKRYIELQGLVIQAYTDIYILEGFEHYNKEVTEKTMALPQCSFSVVRHLCKLALLDLGLTLWKLTDRNPKSNTITSISSYLEDHCEKECRYKEAPLTKHVIKVLDDIRNEYLAHNDITKSSKQLSVFSLKSALEDVKNHLNSLCYPDVDNRVSTIEKEIIFKEAYEIKFGLAVLLENSNMIDTAEQSESIGDDHA